MGQVVEFFLHGRQGLIHSKVNTMDVDDLATQETRASAAMVDTYM